MSKDALAYQGSFTSGADSFHIAESNFIKLINFDVSSSALKARHRELIAKQVVPYLVAATQSLGPGDYKLRCQGSASASGQYDKNNALADARARSAANYAIELYKKQAANHPHVALCPMTAEPAILDNDNALNDAVARKLKWGNIDKHQNHYRSALFVASAGRSKKQGDNVFFIREINLMTLEAKEEKLPDALEKLKKYAPFATKIPGLKTLLENIDKALGPYGKAASAMLKFLVPNAAVACYEIKDAGNVHALYRFDGSQHTFNFDIIPGVSLKDLLDALTTLVSVLDWLEKNAPQLGPGFAAHRQQIEQLKRELRPAIMRWVREYADEQMANAIDKALLASEQGVSPGALVFGASEFAPFQFHDQSANHSVLLLNGPARRTVFGVGTVVATDLDFAGYVPNDWSKYVASAHIQSRTVALLATGSATGSLAALRKGYTSDIDLSNGVPVSG